MDIKDYLRKYRVVTDEANALSEQMVIIKSQAEKVTASLTGMPSGSGEDKIQSAVERMDEALAKYDAKVKEMIQTRTEIEELLFKLPYHERRVLWLRYINGRRYEYIAQAMHYDIRQVFRIHRMALIDLSALIDDGR